MTPSNPTNGQPLIYRIMDALGVTHLVACINHTHEQSEVEGLTAALNSKAPINHIHYFIGEDTDESAAEVTASEDTVHIEVRNEGGGGECDITPSNIGNLARALETPDATPTANSDNLVTSGGVYSALAGKMDNRQFDSDPTLNSTKLVTSGNIRKAMNAVGAIQIHGVIEDPSFVVAFENYSQWWSNGETELHYIMQKSSGSPVAVKTQFRSNTGIVYFADDLGDVSPSRWPIVTVRRGMNGTTPIFTVTLDGVYTPS